MKHKNTPQDTHKNGADEILDELYRSYQANRKKTEVNSISENKDLEDAFNQVDKHSSDFNFYQQQRDKHWDNLVKKAKRNTKQTTNTKGMKLTKWSTYFMLMGILLGLILHPLFQENTPWVEYLLNGFSQFGEYFINSLKYAAIPLVIISLIDAIISVDKSNALWRISRKSIFLNWHRF